MKVAILSPVAWRTPPEHYGPWEQVAYNIAEGMVKAGCDVTLFATLDSVTNAKLDGITKKGYEEDRSLDAKVVECLHISHLMEQASRFDIIHNNFDFLPLSYSGLITTPVITTIHGFSSEKIIPVYKKYNSKGYYVSISMADRHPDLHYAANIYHGIKTEDFALEESPGEYLLFFGRIHPDKGTYDAIQIAKACKKKLIIAGIVQDQNYFEEKVKPFIDGHSIIFEGHAGAEQRKELLGNALALLHPIYFNEPFGLSVAESMFCGTPVIAYNRGSMPELIKQGVSGFLVKDQQEAVEKVAALTTINRRACWEYATEKFSYKKMIDSYLALYHNVVSRQSIA